jgi:hypothetical protein
MSNSLPVKPQNSAYITLGVIAGAGVAIGIVLFLVAGTNGEKALYDPDAAKLIAGTTLWGGALLSLGVTATLLVLVVAAVRWSPAAGTASKTLPSVRGPVREYLRSDEGPQLSVYDNEVWLEGGARGSSGGSLRGVKASFLAGSGPDGRNEAYITGPTFDLTFKAGQPTSDEQVTSFRKVIDFINERSAAISSKD